MRKIFKIEEARILSDEDYDQIAEESEKYFKAIKERVDRLNTIRPEDWHLRVI